MTAAPAWLRGLLRGDTEVIAQVSTRCCTPGRIHLLDVVDGEAAELVAEPANDYATRRARAIADLRGLEHPQGGQR